MVTSNKRGVGIWAFLGGGSDSGITCRRLEPAGGRERGLDFPSNMNASVEPQAVALGPLHAKAEPGPCM